MPRIETNTQIGMLGVMPGGTYTFALTLSKPDPKKGKDLNGNIRQFYETYFRNQQPCYGELAMYAQTHEEDGDRFINPTRPGDLTNPFPAEGKPVELVVRLIANQSLPDTNSNRKVLDAALNKRDSPFRKGLGESNTYQYNGTYLYLVFKGFQDTDASILIYMLRTFARYGFKGYTDKHISEGLSAIDFLKMKIMTRMYCSNPRSVLTDTPRNITRGTFENRYCYNRPEIDKIWSDAGLFADDFNSFLYKTDQRLATRIKHAPGMHNGQSFTKTDVDKVFSLIDDYEKMKGKIKTNTTLFRRKTVTTSQPSVFKKAS